MNKTFVSIIAAAGLALTGGVALAHMHDGPATNAPQMMQQGPGTHAGPGAAQLPQGDRGPASLAFHGVNAKMHAEMDIAYTGDVDADFVRGMIPHHAGAVDMAKIVLAFGKDPEVRKLAEAIIKAQQEEIAWMTEWLKKRSN